VYSRHDVHATAEEKLVLRRLSAQDIVATSIAGDPIETVLTEAPGDRQPIGGLKITTARGWIAVRPSGTEDVYKMYAESFAGPAHLEQLETAARTLVADVLERRRARGREVR
jgi:phosphoglucomutase